MIEYLKSVDIANYLYLRVYLPTRPQLHNPITFKMQKFVLRNLNLFKLSLVSHSKS